MKLNAANILFIIGGLFIIASISYPFYKVSGLLLYQDQVLGNYVYIVILLGFLSMIAPILLETNSLKRFGKSGNFLLFFAFSAILTAILLRSFSSFGSNATLSSGFYIYVIGIILIFIGALNLFRIKD